VSALGEEEKSQKKNNNETNRVIKGKGNKNKVKSTTEEKTADTFHFEKRKKNYVRGRSGKMKSAEGEVLNNKA
jgi:hypothetical protein